MGIEMSDNHQKINSIWETLNLYDEGTITADTCIVSVERKLMEDKLALLRDGKWVANWSFGCSISEVSHTYALMEHNDWATWYYPFTFFNAVRFFWNRAMRWLDRHRWTRVR
jgi:hypothetical protein